MPSFINISGQIFGRLVVLKRAGTHHKGGALWECKCVCGETTFARSTTLKLGKKKGCGKCRKTNFKHGFYSGSGNRTYRIWKSMKQRCSSDDFPSYGKRGITVCQRWADSFTNFVEDMGECPSIHYSIDRRDSSKGYFKTNCRWATLQMQARNKRNSKVTLPIALQILRDREAGATLKTTANRYGLTIGNVHNVCSGKTFVEAQRLAHCSKYNFYVGRP